MSQTPQLGTWHWCDVALPCTVQSHPRSHVRGGLVRGARQTWQILLRLPFSALATAALWRPLCAPCTKALFKVCLISSAVCRDQKVQACHHCWGIFGHEPMIAFLRVHWPTSAAEDHTKPTAASCTIIESGSFPQLGGSFVCGAQRHHTGTRTIATPMLFERANASHL
jgi:hypothetical protein